MSANPSKKCCQICGKSAALRRAIIVRPVVAQLIAKETGHWDENGWICQDDLRHFQSSYVTSLLATEKGELTTLEQGVLDSMRQQEILAQNPDQEFDSKLSFGQRLADHIADFGGSWRFIILFGAVIVIWMLLNSWVLITRPFDPYPFILLNLVLSCLAALQAPVIMMSQNRQEDRDRQRAMHDYQVNLKAELEIRHLHQKIDHLISHQWERMMEIQEIQIEMINELRRMR